MDCDIKFVFGDALLIFYFVSLLVAEAWNFYLSQCESNARFVKWKDGTMQLLIGNEVLDISVHDAHHDQSHLFLRNGKVNYFFSTAFCTASLFVSTHHYPILSSADMINFEL